MQNEGDSRMRPNPKGDPIKKLYCSQSKLKHSKTACFPVASDLKVKNSSLTGQIPTFLNVPLILRFKISRNFHRLSRKLQFFTSSFSFALFFDFPFMSRFPKAIKVFLAQWNFLSSIALFEACHLDDVNSRDGEPKLKIVYYLVANILTNHRLSGLSLKTLLFLFPSDFSFRFFSFSITNWFSRTCCDFFLLVLFSVRSSSHRQHLECAKFSFCSFALRITWRRSLSRARIV